VKLALPAAVYWLSPFTALCGGPLLQFSSPANNLVCHSKRVASRQVRHNLAEKAERGHHQI
jgi:hypothetical protein